MNTQLSENRATFFHTYLAYLTDLVYFEKHPDYEYTRQTCANISALAEKVIEGLITGAASKDGLAVQRTCKQLNIRHTYKAIREYLVS